MTTIIKNFNMKSAGVMASVLVFAIMAGSCSKKDNKSTQTTATVTEAEKVYPVHVQSISLQAIERTIDYTANLIPSKEIHYGPASPGRIDRILVETGSRVSKGQVLVEMDKTQLNQAKTQFENAKNNFQRLDTLYKLGSTSEQQYEQVKTAYDLAKINYRFLLENSTLISPINGVVTGKYYENGEMYSAAPNALTGKASIVSLQQINPLKAEVSVSQHYFPDVKVGMQTEITNEVYAGSYFNGKVTNVFPTIDPTTRTFKVEISIDNPSETLRPGMFANIAIKLKSEDAMVVPAIAVLKQEGTDIRYVFVNNNGVAHRINVKMGKRYDDKVEVIASEIKAGLELVVDGQANLMEGSKITIAQ